MKCKVCRKADVPFEDEMCAPCGRDVLAKYGWSSGRVVDGRLYRGAPDPDADGRIKQRRES